MERNQIVFFLLFVLAGTLIFTDHILAGSFNAELRDDGIVVLSGTESFDCIPEGNDYGSWAIIKLNGTLFAHPFYAGRTIILDETYDLSCQNPGKYFFSVVYGGYSWRETVSGNTCSDIISSEEIMSVIVLPSKQYLYITSPKDIVSGQASIDIFYDFAYTSELIEDRTIQVFVDNKSIFRQVNLPKTGNVSIPFDFSAKKGFVLIKATAGCSGHNRTVEKLVYVDPEDGCPLNVGKPVNVASGNVYISETDFTIKGAMQLDFTRYYDSSESTMRGFGQGWGHTYDTRAIQFPNSVGNTYKVINPNGFNVYYIDNDGDGVFDVEFPKGEKSRLIKNGNVFAREYFDGRKEEFNADGYMTALVDKNGNRLTLTRSSGNKLTQITDPSGRIITVSYYPSSSTKITSITLPDGRTIQYTYGTHLSKVTYPDNGERNYEYVYKTGVGWRLTGTRNENGNYVEKHDYDSKGRAINSSSDGTNEKLSINYINDSQSTVTDSLGRVTTYTFDKTLGTGHAITVTGPGCKSCGQGGIAYTYDANMNVTSIIDANGNVTVRAYDATGNMIEETKGYGTEDEIISTYIYNDFGQVLTITDSDGIITDYTYDAKGNMIVKTEAYGTIDEQVTTYAYNENGQMVTLTDPSGNITTYTYDQHGNRSSVTNALNQTITYSYDLTGNLIALTDVNGNVTTYEYDLRDRLVKENNPNGSTIVYEYDHAGNRTATTDANGNRTTFTYDRNNRLITTAYPEGDSVNYTYDSENNLISMLVRDRESTVIKSESYTFDDFNRLSRRTYANAVYTEQSHDALGNLVMKQDEKGNITNHAYDALRRLKSLTDAHAGYTSFSYDGRSNITAFSDANGNTTYYIYDRLNRLISITSPDTGTTLYSYDANGNMITRTDANGVVTTYSYDALNRLTETRSFDSVLSTYIYDNCMNGTGKLCVVSDRSGITRYDYNSMGKVVREAKQIDDMHYLTEYSYDLNGNISETIYPGGRRISYTYDRNNKVISVSKTNFGATQILADHIAYVPDGDVISTTYGNGITDSRGYDVRNGLSNLVTQTSSLHTLNSYRYSRDDTGNITTLIDNINPSKNRTYAYDDLHRLTLAAGPWGSITYAYDPAGNRTLESTDTGSTIYKYTGNKLTSSTGEQSFNFDYDNNGNTIAAGSKEYIYDQNQRLVATKIAGQILSENIYNDSGQRVIKNTSGQATVFHYDQNGLLVAESAGSGMIRNEYVYLNDRPLARMSHVVLGSGYNYPALSYRASLSLSIDSSNIGTGWLKYYYTRNRLSLVSTSITGFTLDGNTVTISGTGTINGTSVCTFIATITDGSSDSMGIEIRKADGTLHYRSVSQVITGGNYTIGDNVYYFHNDHLGTPTMMTDSSGSIVWQGEFKPFGEALSISGSVVNNLRFPGQYFDEETGLHQNWRRDYSPDIGRYIEADPILQPIVPKITKTSCAGTGVRWHVPRLLSNPQNLYPYVYARGNPIVLMDPTGLVCGSGWTDWIVPDRFFGYDFTRCCQNHDDCYGCKGKSQGLSKGNCDQDFCGCLMEDCEHLYGYSKKSCEGKAKLYCWAVRRFGDNAYDNARKCCI